MSSVMSEKAFKLKKFDSRKELVRMLGLDKRGYLTKIMAEEDERLKAEELEIKSLGYCKKCNYILTTSGKCSVCDYNKHDDDEYEQDERFESKEQVEPEGVEIIELDW